MVCVPFVDVCFLAKNTSCRPSTEKTLCGKSEMAVYVIFWQIQFPALDIRLSYNDILLFLAIAKSIPASKTPPASSSHSVEATIPSKSSTKQKTRSIRGKERPMHTNKYTQNFV